MTPAIFAKTFTRASVEEVFDAVAAHGLACVQFNCACAGLPPLPDQLEPALVERIARAAARLPVALAALSGTFNMIHPDPARRRDGLRRLEVLAGACPRLAIPVITLCTGTRDPDDMWRAHPDNASSRAWRDLRATLDAALEIATRHQVTLGIEPEAGNVVGSARLARRLLDEVASPRLGIVLDAANLLATADRSRDRAVLDEAFALLGERVVLAHAKELAPGGHGGHLAPGAGVLDWDHYLGGLQRCGFRGPLVLHGFEEPAAAAGIQFIRTCLGRLPARPSAATVPSTPSHAHVSSRRN